MRNFLLAAMAAAALFGAGVAGALGQTSDDGRNRWMKITNDSALIAYQVYIIPSTKDCCWSRDLLENEVIHAKAIAPAKAITPAERRSSLFVNFDDGFGSCLFDVRITNQYPGWDWNFYSINVCAGKGARQITLKGALPEKSKDDKDRWVTVDNQSQHTAYRLFSIPSDEKECCWSYDLLGAHVIRKGSFLNVEIDDGSGKCRFDIRVTSSQDREWTFYGIDVCTEERITLK